MREILFRGKRVDNGEWVYGYYVKVGRYGYILTGKLDVCKGRRDFEYYTVDIETVGQYTGLTDKNGKKIFEGDIVDGLFRFTTPVRAVCVFKAGAFGLAWTHGGVDHFSAFTSICNVEYEVVGNIYDNPELLEVEE